MVNEKEKKIKEKEKRNKRAERHEANGENKNWKDFGDGRKWVKGQRDKLDQLKLSGTRKGEGQRLGEGIEAARLRAQIKHLNRLRAKLQIAHSGEMKMALSIRTLACKRSTTRLKQKVQRAFEAQGKDVKLVNAEAKDEWSQRKGRLKSQDTGDIPG